MKLWLTYILLLFFIPAFAQNEGNIWYFGDSAGISFNGAQPVPVLNSIIYSNEASSAICNKNGQLRAYAGCVTQELNRIVLWDKNCNPIANGINLYGASTITQGLLLLPKPLSNNIYYLFHLGLGMNYNKLYVSKIITNNSNSLDSVYSKNIVLHYNDSLITEKMTAIRHGNGHYWWIILHTFDTNIFIKYLVTCDTILGPYEQSIGSNYGDFLHFGGAGQLVSSSQGNKIASVSQNGIIDVFDFDRCTGEIYNWLPLGNNSLVNYGCAFSKNASKLYISTISDFHQQSCLYQFDLNASDILQSKILLHQYNNTHYTFGQLLLAPDNKIYIAKTLCLSLDSIKYDSINMYLGVIQNPDMAGLQCNFVLHGFYLGGRRAFLGLPNIPNYRLGALVGSACDTILDPVPPEPETSNNMVYIPNIFSPNADGQNDIFYIRGSQIASVSLMIYNRWGEQVFETTDINHGWDGTHKGKKCADGAYYYVAEITFGNGETVSRKGNVTLVR